MYIRDKVRNLEIDGKTERLLKSIWEELVILNEKLNIMERKLYDKNDKQKN